MSNKLRTEFNNKIRNKYLKDNNISRCSKCNMPKTSYSNLEIHHMTPLSVGGTNDDDNLIALCSRCHDEWHCVEGLDITFDRWMRIPPYYVIVHMILSIDENIDSKEKEILFGINKSSINNMLEWGFEVYKDVKNKL